MVNFAAKVTFDYYRVVTPMLRLCNFNIKRMLSISTYARLVSTYINTFALR